MLDQRHHLDLTQVDKELLKLIQGRAVEDQVRSEYEDRGCENGQYLKALKTKNSIPKQVDLNQSLNKKQ